MAKTELLMLIAIAALVSSTEVDDVEQKKRGVAKGTSLNTIPTGAQKQDYTYSIYSQNPSSQSSSSPYPQAPNSFYPSQSNQYYTSNTPAEPSYSPQPQQINLIPPSSSSQFVPINFVPNPGYQSKYQIIPSKPSGNIQFALIPQPSNFNAQSLIPYSQIPQSLFAPTPGNPISPNQNPFNSFSPQGQFNVAPNLPLSLGNNYLGQSSTMLLLAQPNSSPYNNIFQNPAQTFPSYNFPSSNFPSSNYPSSFPTNSQNRYGVPYSSGASDVQIQSSLTKEDNDLSAQTSEYTAPSDSSTNYKTAYASSRSSYSKL